MTYFFAYSDKITALSYFRFYCLDVIKMTKLLTPRAQVNNCFFPYQTVYFKNDKWREYGMTTRADYTRISCSAQVT